MQRDARKVLGCGFECVEHGGVKTSIFLQPCCSLSWGAGWEGAASALNCSFRVKVDETIRGSKSSLPHKCPLLD
eukprot:scaffold248932_cov21-Tisochrysis_lutea.AAC.1